MVSSVSERVRGMFERTFLVNIDEHVRMIRTHPQQIDGHLKYYLHRDSEDEPWVPWRAEPEPTEHVLEYARGRLADGVVGKPIGENQTRLDDFGGEDGGGVQNGASTVAACD